MWSEENVRGLMYIIVVIMICAFIGLMCHPRTKELAISYAESGQRARRAWYEKQDPTGDSLFYFDPNTVDYKELRLLGFDKRTAVGIIKYRTKGKVFSVREDLALCYGVTDSIYLRLEPYIRIGEEYAAKPAESIAVRDTLPRVTKQRFAPHPFESFRIDTVGVAYLRRIGFSTRQARALIEYRDRGDGIYDIDELRDCYAVSAEMADSLARYVIFSVRDPHRWMVDINKADSMALLRVHGIGAKTASAVLEYRKLLGGYYSIAQIAELKCVTPENFARISKQIYCDSCVISKIDINFAAAESMEYHPYMTRRAINRIVKLRESKGGWSNVEEMIDDDIFTTEQAAAIAPYLHFGTTPQDF